MTNLLPIEKIMESSNSDVNLCFMFTNIYEKRLSYIYIYIEKCKTKNMLIQKINTKIHFIKID